VTHRDILISSVAATLAGAIMMLRQLAWWGRHLVEGATAKTAAGALSFWS